MEKTLLSILACGSIVFSVLSIPTHAQTQLIGEHIRSYDVEMEIQPDGRVSVTESIRYDFGNDQRHGIFRHIPYLLEIDDKRYAIDIDEIEVTDESGVAYKFQKTDDGNEIELKIGDPDAKITGVHEYNISYMLSGALRYNQDTYDELYANVIGSNWDVPIAKARIRVSLPQLVDTTDPELEAICFTGSYGAEEQDCTVLDLGNSFVISSTSVLQPGEGITVAVKFPKDTVATLQPEEVVTFWDTPTGAVLLIGIIILAIVFAVIWYIFLPIGIAIGWFLYGRDPGVGKAVSAWFDPPETKKKRKLTPAESGALIDEKVHFRDVSGMIVHLAQRGYYTIKEEKKKGVFGTSSEFSFIKKKDFAQDPGLMPFEKKLLQKLFLGRKTVQVKDLQLYKTIEKIEKDIYNGLVQEGFFPKNPDKIRRTYTVITVLAMVTLNVFLAISAAVFGRAMPRKTLFGAQQANVAKGLRNFLRSQEAELQFQGEQQLLFEKFLPYAVAFGVEDHWAKRFEKLNLQKPDWYEGDFSHGFSAVAFTNSLNSSTSQVSEVSSPPSSGSSSGFSGGFSGGGFGGGGGGSW
jgi:uncharacterized membrane protein